MSNESAGADSLVSGNSEWMVSNGETPKPPADAADRLTLVLSLPVLALLVSLLLYLGWSEYIQVRTGDPLRLQGSVRWLAGAVGLTGVYVLWAFLKVRRLLQDADVSIAQLEDIRIDAKRRERELRVLLKSVQEVMFRTDTTGLITYVNERWAALHGQSLNEARGRQLIDMIDEEDRTKVARLFSVDSRAGVRTTTARMRSTTGVVYRFDMALMPLRSSNGLVGFAGSAVDITEREAAQQALQQQLAFMAQLLEINPMPMATFDAAGRYLSVNRAWEAFMGLKRGEVIGKQGSHFMPKADAALHAERDRELWLMGGPVRYEAKVKHMDGTRRDVVVTKLIIPGDQNQPPGVLSNMMDVSEFRAAERATREAKEAAEETSRVKSEFIANISHELRTPLQSILGFSELGISRSSDAQRLQNMFREIHESGARMLALVNDLLDISKIESAVGAITLERADVRGLVKAVLKELSPLLHAKRLHLNCDLGEHALIAKVDPVRFQQVVRNVLANAIKFSPIDGEIEVSGGFSDDDQVCICIRDHGMGIPANETEFIFAAFTQSSKTKDGSGGTGLGLAICRKIMDAHGGSITADNMPDGGAVFSMMLPKRHHLDRDTTLDTLL